MLVIECVAYKYLNFMNYFDMKHSIGYSIERNEKTVSVRDTHIHVCAIVHAKCTFYQEKRFQSDMLTLVSIVHHPVAFVNSKND